MRSSKASSSSDYLSTWVLAPFWVVRLGLLLALLGYHIYLLTLLVRFMDDALGLYIIHAVRDGGFTRTILSAIAVAVLITCVVFELICILKRTRATLSPRFLLLATVLQAALWTAIFVPSMITFHDEVLRGSGIALAISLWALVFYAAVLFYQQSRNSNSYRTFGDEEQTAFKQYVPYDSALSRSQIPSPEPSMSRYEPVRERTV